MAEFLSSTCTSTNFLCDNGCEKYRTWFSQFCFFARLSETIFKRKYKSLLNVFFFCCSFWDCVCVCMCVCVLFCFMLNCSCCTNFESAALKSLLASFFSFFFFLNQQPFVRLYIIFSYRTTLFNNRPGVTFFATTEKQLTIFPF